MACMDKISTKQNLFRRKIVQEESCLVWNYPREDTDHVLFNCSKAKTLQNSMRVPRHIMSLDDSSFSIRLKKACLRSSYFPFFQAQWGTLIAFGCQTLSKQRNMSVFELQAKWINPLRKTLSLASEFLFLGPKNCAGIKEKQQILISWEPPTPQFSSLILMDLLQVILAMLEQVVSFAIIIGMGRRILM